MRKAGNERMKGKKRDPEVDRRRERRGNYKINGRRKEGAERARGNKETRGDRRRKGRGN